jgi:type VI secretion system protein ImpA
MNLREDLLSPIPGDNPSGLDLRYSTDFQQIEQALKQDDDLPQGVWEAERKQANYAAVVEISQDALATRGKHLQLATWLAEALLRDEGFSGLHLGLKTCHGLLENFWDTLYPTSAPGRAKYLSLMSSTLPDAAKKVRLTSGGDSWYRLKESRLVGYEKDAQTDVAKKNREKLLKEGKLSAEAFDKSFAATPKAFYVSVEKDLNDCLSALAQLDTLCRKRFEELAPSFALLRGALEEVQRDVRGLLQKKRAAEPDPVEAAPEPVVAPVRPAEPIETVRVQDAVALSGPAPIAAQAVLLPVNAHAEPADRRDAITAIANAAAYLRKHEPYSPAPYLMLRGLRWGELRAALALADPTAMEAPPTEIRQHAKRLALNRQWKELLEFAESVMALPCSRAWLDVQRLAVEACIALGDEYNSITVAIRSELRTLIRDFPELLDARLMDDTAVANTETQRWLRELIAEPEHAPPDIHLSANGALDGHVPGWQRTFIDSSILADQAFQAGQEQKAFEILSKEVGRQQSGRGRFQRKLQLVQLCLTAGKDAIAQPLLEDIAATIENHKLEDWEDRELVVSALATIMRSSKKVQGDAKEKQKLFERICRLDPVQALKF